MLLRQLFLRHFIRSITTKRDQLWKCFIIKWCQMRNYVLLHIICHYICSNCERIVRALWTLLCDLDVSSIPLYLCVCVTMHNSNMLHWYVCFRKSQWLGNFFLASYVSIQMEILLKEGPHHSRTPLNHFVDVEAIRARCYTPDSSHCNKFHYLCNYHKI